MNVIAHAGQLTPSGVSDVLGLAEVTGATDGVFPLSEDVVLRVKGGGDAAEVVHLTVLDGDGPAGGGLVGYAHLDLGEPDEGPAGELFVHPAHRRRGIGRALVDEAVRAAAKADAQGRLRFWAHGDDPGARALAELTGFARVRVLWRMRRSLTTELPDQPGLPDMALPDGVTLRAFRPGADDAAWLAVNARAFAHHPEQGRWTRDDLRLRMAEPWFDPAGFLLAVDAHDTLLGFHWTKRQSDSLGEIYVLGVDPGGHRRGLGAALSVAGLRYLRGQGITDAMLYVDESNAAAVKLYDRLGFAIWSTDVSYQK